MPRRRWPRPSPRGTRARRTAGGAGASSSRAGRRGRAQAPRRTRAPQRSPHSGPSRSLMRTFYHNRVPHGITRRIGITTEHTDITEGSGRGAVCFLPQRSQRTQKRWRVVSRQWEDHVGETSRPLTTNPHRLLCVLGGRNTPFATFAAFAAQNRPPHFLTSVYFVVQSRRGGLNHGKLQSRMVGKSESDCAPSRRHESARKCPSQTGFLTIIEGGEARRHGRRRASRRESTLVLCTNH